METSGTQPTPNAGFSGEEFVVEEQPIGLPWRLAIFAVVIFVFSLFIYFGLKFGYEKYLSSQTVAVTGQLDALAKQVSSEDEEKFITFYSQILHLKTALDSHLYSGNVFGVLERAVLPTVYFTSADVDMSGPAVTLDGTTGDFQSLAGQMASFEKASEVSNVTLKSITLSNGSVHFTLIITFQEQAFLQQRS